MDSYKRGDFATALRERKPHFRRKELNILFLAIALPGIYFIVTGNIIRGIIALILMGSAFFTLFIPGGWIIASIWAIMFRNTKIRKGELKETKKQMAELTDAVRESKEDKG